MKRSLFIGIFLAYLLTTAPALGQSPAGCSTQPFVPPGIGPVGALYNVFLFHEVLVTVTINGKFVFSAVYGTLEAFVLEGSVPAGYGFDPNDVSAALQKLCSLPPLIRVGKPHVAQRLATAGGKPAFGQAAGLNADADFNGDGLPDTAQLNGNLIAITLFNPDGTTLSTSRVSLGPNFLLGGGVLVAADFNMDGKIDLAVPQDDPTGANNGSILILPGNGDGTFGQPIKVPVGVATLGFVSMSLGIGDFNSDGIPDLAVSGDAQTIDPNSGYPIRNSQLQVLLGHGDGTFAAPQTYNVSAQSIVSADFNNDGIPDLAVLDSQNYTLGSDQVWILPGNGDGTFRAPAATTSGTPTGTQKGYLAFTDLNHDGNLDLVIDSQLTNAVATLLGHGDGTFQPPTFTVAGTQATPNSVAPLPFADGNTALCTYDALTGNLMMQFATPDGFINSPPIQPLGTQLTGIVTADVNGDGRPDLLIAESLQSAGANGNLYVLDGIGNGTFATPAAYPLGANPSALAIGDLNHDGSLDAVVADATGVDVRLGDGAGGFGPLATYPSASRQLGSLALADFNQDGNPDVIASNGAGLSLFLGNGDGTLAAETVIPLDIFPANPTLVSTVIVADVNGDGRPDVIVGSNPLPTSLFTAGPLPPGAFSILLNAGNGTFNPPANTILPGQFTGGLSVADVNGDGIPDLIAGYPGKIAVFFGNGDGTFQSPITTPTATQATTIAVADMNGDSILDLIVGECCSIAEPSYMLGNGNGTFQPEVRFPDGPGLLGVAIADFNGDGRPDLVTIGDTGAGPYQGFLTLLMNAWGGLQPAQ